MTTKRDSSVKVRRTKTDDPNKVEISLLLKFDIRDPRNIEIWDGLAKLLNTIFTPEEKEDFLEQFQGIRTQIQSEMESEPSS